MKKKSCILTIANQEYEMTPIWLSYYRQFFSDEDIYYLNNSELSMEDLHIPSGINFINIKETNPTRETHFYLRDSVQEYTNRLLEEYEYCIFAEIDEIIVPNPKIYKTFNDIYINRNVKVTGFHVLHSPDEPPYNPSSKILKQRKKWKRDAQFDKVLILNSPVQYDLGFHFCKPDVVNKNDVFLVHLHYFDKEILLKRLNRSRNFKWQNDNPLSGWQNRCSDAKVMEHFNKMLSSSTCIDSSIQDFI